MSTGCGEFENLLAGYDALDQGERARVDAHVARCAACAALAQALTELGTVLEAEYGAVCAPPSLLDRVGARLSPAPPPRPRAAAAFLDLAAWSAVACAAAAVTRYFTPPEIALTQTMLYASAGAFMLGGLAIALWSLRERED